MRVLKAALDLLSSWELQGRRLAVGTYYRGLTLLSQTEFLMQSINVRTGQYSIDI